MIWSSKKQDKASPAQVGNGGAGAATERYAGKTEKAPGSAGGQPASDNPLSAEEVQRRAAITIRRSVAFAQAVLLLMHSPRHKHLSLADLEWAVIPGLATGQLRIGEVKTKKGNVSVPAALVSWASVSAEVDKRLSANLDAPIRLQPNEWRSGEVLWLVDAVGNNDVIQAMLNKLGAKELKGRSIKTRARGKDGKLMVQVLQPKAA